MRSHYATSSLVLAFPFMLLFFSHLSAGQATPPAINQLRSAVLEAKTSREAGEACKAFFKDMRGEDLLRQQNDPDLGIALQAAWERAVARSSGTKTRPNPQRFLGFIEGRTRLSIPLRWEVALLRRALEDRPDLAKESVHEYLSIAPFLTKSKYGTVFMEPEAYSDSPFGFRVPAGTQVTKANRRVAVKVGDAAIRIDEALLQRLQRDVPADYKALWVALGTERSFIALYDDAGRSFPLVCVDSKSGNLFWRTRSWADGAENLLGFNGQVWNNLQFCVTDKDIAVFGDAWAGCYCEIYCRESGAVRARFSTNYWCAPHK